MAAKLLRLVIIGAPGSGKGTISSWMVKDFGLKHLAAGDLIRSQIRNQTEDGILAKGFTDKGQLVPDTLVTKLVFNELNQPQLNSADWLLDGYPRNLNQARSLSGFVSLTKVVDLHVPHQIIIDRIKGRLIHEPSGRVYNLDFSPPRVPGRDDVTGEPLIQRDDDRPEVVKARLENYQALTDPILEYYRGQGLLVQFSGTKSKEIYQQLHRYLSEKVVVRASN